MTKPLELTREFLKVIRENSLEAFKTSLAHFSMPKKRADDMAAGFADGMTALLMHLVNAGLVEVVDAPKKENP